MASPAFRLVSSGGNPVIALPARSRAARLRSTTHINGFTPKRWLFKNLLKGAVALGVDRLLTSAVRDPLHEYSGIETRAFIAALNRVLDDRVATISIRWPWPVWADRGRIYVYAFDRQGRVLAFTKIVLEEKQDRQLRNEAEMLNALKDGTRRCRVPKPIALDSIDGRLYLVTEPLPERLRPLRQDSAFPAEAAAELAGPVRTVPGAALFAMPWWLRFEEEARSVPGLAASMKARFDGRMAQTCRVHGDFSPKNILRDGGDYWIVDWETGSLEGPRFADPLYYQLEARPQECEQRPVETLEALFRQYDTGEEGGIAALAAALAYLYSVDCVEARRLLPHWHQLSEGYPA